MSPEMPTEIAGEDRLRNAPLGTKAPAIGGGHWIKGSRGWGWMKKNGIYPRPGADWDGNLIYPGPVTKCLRLPEGDENAPGQGPCGCGCRTKEQLLVENEALKALAREHLVNMEFDCPGDALEPCGMWCAVCKRHVDDDKIGGHADDCLLRGEAPKQVAEE